MYYLLAPRYQLAGYQKLPFAIHDLHRSKTEFLNREQFGVVYHCDGQHDLDEEELTEGGRSFLAELVKKGFVSCGETQGKLKPYQEYVYYDNRFKESVQWSVTGKCNYRCRHCFMSAPDAKYGHPTKEQCLTLIRQMEECGIKNVYLTGGEPLVRSDFIELVEALTEHHIHISCILTNGKLVDDTLLDGLERNHQHPSFQMSYDGNGWHDWMRGIDGAEETVLRAFRLLRERGYNTSCSMALHKKSIGSIRESVLTLRDVGCGSLKINAASPSGEWVRYPEYFLTIDETYQAFLDYIPQYFEDDAPVSIMLEGCFLYTPGMPKWFMVSDKNTDGSFERIPVCGPLRNSIYVAPEGDVLPCQSMITAPIAKRYPNVFETPLKSILTDSAYLDDACSNLSVYMEKNPECARCPHAAHCCGGCRAKGVETCGDNFFAPDRQVCAFYLDGWYEKFKAVAGKEFTRFAENGGVERGAARKKNCAVTQDC